MQFSGRWIANIESKIQCKAKEETTTRTPSQRTINRRVESNINQIDGKITQLTEETTENTQKITKVEQDVNGICNCGKCMVLNRDAVPFIGKNVILESITRNTKESRDKYPLFARFNVE